MSLVLELLAHVEEDAPRNVSQLLDRFLGKCCEITGSDAGTAYIVRRRGRGREHVLDPVIRQNTISTNRLAPDDAIPLNAATIAGYVAGSGEVESLADVNRVPTTRPYQFNAAIEAPGFDVGALVCFPIMTFQGRVVAVVELVMHRGTSEKKAFSGDTIDGLVEVAAVISGYVERTDNLEQIEKKNVKLRQRNKTLARQRELIGQLQEETEEAFKLSISLLARAAEIHDEGTGNHIVRVNEYAFFLAQRLGKTKDFCDEIRYSAQLHDVGKLSVDQGILNKKGELINELTTDSTGYYNLNKVWTGDYSIRIEPEYLKNRKLSSSPESIHIKLNGSDEFITLETFTLVDAEESSVVAPIKQPIIN